MLIRALIFSIVASVACGSPPEPAADASSEPDLHVEADTVVAEVEHALPNPTGMLEVPLDGYQIQVGPFTVPPGEEIVLCNYVDLGNATTRDLSRLQTAMKAGSQAFVRTTSTASVNAVTRPWSAITAAAPP